jgi:hypothetical protein
MVTIPLTAGDIQLAQLKPLPQPPEPQAGPAAFEEALDAANTDRRRWT